MAEEKKYEKISDTEIKITTIINDQKEKVVSMERAKYDIKSLTESIGKATAEREAKRIELDKYALMELTNMDNSISAMIDQVAGINARIVEAEKLGIVVPDVKADAPLDPIEILPVEEIKG